MASSKEYLNFILEQLSGLEDITHRAMMGEYVLYYRGKVFGGIYDDRFLVQPTKSAKAMMLDADMELSYEGAKEMILVDDVDNREFLRILNEKMKEIGYGLILNDTKNLPNGKALVRLDYQRVS